VKNRYNLSSSRLNYVWYKFNKNSHFNSVLYYLESQNYLVRTYQGEEVDIPQLMIATSPLMRDAYKKYGDSITFDITYNLLRPRSTEGNRQWGLGIVSGFGSNLEPIIFAYCLIARENK
jgi:hypothetical protein